MTIEAVLEFWFGLNSDDAAVAKEKSAFWWSKNPQFDDEIRLEYTFFLVPASE